MFGGNVPNYLWRDAILTVAYLINRVPTHVLNYHTPLNNFKTFFPTCRLHTNPPLKVFGCTIFVHNTLPLGLNLIPRLKNAFSLDMSQTKEGTDVLILAPKNYMLA